jgi:hypothetical protein
MTVLQNFRTLDKPLTLDLEQFTSTYKNRASPSTPKPGAITPTQINEEIEKLVQMTLELGKTEEVKTNYAIRDNTMVNLPDVMMSQLTKGDIDPLYKHESIEYPIETHAGVYTESFFESFIGKTNLRPIPGSKRGHEFASRPSSDFYMIGGKVESNGDGTGTAHFMMYIPPMGDPESNEAFRRDCKANMVNFSLVTLPEYYTEMVEGNEITKFTRSVGYERNDAVEWGAGAMAQVVNQGTPIAPTVVQDVNALETIAELYNAKLFKMEDLLEKIGGFSLRTNQDIENEATLKLLNGRRLQDVLEENAKAQEILLEGKILEQVGTKEINVGGEVKPNPCFVYIKQKCKYEPVEDVIKGLEADDCWKVICKSLADMNSDVNLIKVGGTEANSHADDGIKDSKKALTFIK